MRILRSLGAAALLSACAVVGLGATQQADAQVGFSYGNWGRGGGVNISVGNPYGYYAPGYPVNYGYPVYSSPVVVTQPYYGGWSGYRPVYQRYWGGPGYGNYGGRGYARNWRGYRRW